MKRKKMGRPSMGREAKKVNVVIRVSPIERKELNRKARAKGVSLSAYIMAPHRTGE